MTYSKRARPAPDHYDDPLGLDDRVLPDVPAPSNLIVTGLSDEDDAARQLALQFDPAVMFCTNCEVPQEKRAIPMHDDLHRCAYCAHPLSLMGTPPRKRKFL